ncbi:hypothetical protein [Lysinibacillus sp. BNK-21]|uniref:hypothetical protein n=1 Tax=Lysinibacillus sp. BNK-21 TaxID=3376156 RepID=UPI003B432A98
MELVKNGEKELLGTYSSEKTSEIFKHLKEKFSGIREHDKDALRLDISPLRKAGEKRPLSPSDFCYFKASAYDEIKSEFDNLVSK